MSWAVFLLYDSIARCACHFLRVTSSDPSVSFMLVSPSTDVPKRFTYEFGPAILTYYVPDSFIRYVRALDSLADELIPFL